MNIIIYLLWTYRHFIILMIFSTHMKGTNKIKIVPISILNQCYSFTKRYETWDIYQDLSCICIWKYVFLLFVWISLIAKNIWTLRRHSLGHWLIDVVKNVTKVSRNRYVFIWFQTFHNGVKFFWRKKSFSHILGLESSLKIR